jgi:hypothetical protein
MIILVILLSVALCVSLFFNFAQNKTLRLYSQEYKKIKLQQSALRAVTVIYGVIACAIIWKQAKQLNSSNPSN